MENWDLASLFDLCQSDMIPVQLEQAVHELNHLTPEPPLPVSVASDPTTNENVNDSDPFDQINQSCFGTNYFQPLENALHQITQPQANESSESPIMTQNVVDENELIPSQQGGGGGGKLMCEELNSPSFSSSPEVENDQVDTPAPSSDPAPSAPTSPSSSSSSSSVSSGPSSTRPENHTPTIVRGDRCNNREIRQFLNIPQPDAVPDYASFYSNVMENLHDLADRVMSMVRRDDAIQVELRGENVRSHVSAVINKEDSVLTTFESLLDRLVQSNMAVMHDPSLELIIQVVEKPTGGGKRKLEKTLDQGLALRRPRWCILLFHQLALQRSTEYQHRLDGLRLHNILNRSTRRLRFPARAMANIPARDLVSQLYQDHPVCNRRCQASTVAAESMCPICEVVYPADIIEMHASTCNDSWPTMTDEDADDDECSLTDKNRITGYLRQFIENGQA
ncbi:uncharacterized protein LOC115381325 [Salarias fasciatus]|uniref:uncharacterized protein LOC115381325 n=1 Tax=Salarias fasciatus TaxID=181472 RepID=UPI001176FFEF|nr:uncharacterized protein LOC115381325 [Salarias fasciatus]